MNDTPHPDLITSAHGVAVAEVDERKLLKTMHWYDGFVMTLSNPGLIIANLGYTTGQIGALGALAVWLGSMVIAVLQNKIYTEPATMFPEHCGGIAMYAFEGWRSRFSLAGPISAIGYWAGWSSVLAIFGLTVGGLVQAQWLPGQTWSVSGIVHLDLPRVIAVALIVALWIINSMGVRPMKILGYLTGGLLFVPLFMFMVAPFFLSDFAFSHLCWGLVGAAGSTWGAVQLALVWLYLNSWSAYGIEVCATFAPEYHDTEQDTRKALIRGAMFCLAVYAILPIALGGAVSQQAMARAPLRFYAELLHREVGGAWSNIIIFFMISSFLLGMNAASAGGARTLYGMSRTGITINWFDHLNKQNVPNRGMFVDVTVNVLAVLFLPTTVAVLAACNMGYVICHVFALSAVPLLRKDRPNLRRPLALSRPWLWLAGILAAFNVLIVAVGSVSFSMTGYGGIREFLIGLALLGIGCVLYMYRRVVQDKQPFTLRDVGPALADGASMPSPAKATA
ncbi:APC family permease [Candidatus Mycobacterium methanotrophicum]|uniref:APC family permease n=1 Tax=Candidatus Mycobacterium methanotrophicum TaxID=2943498 RepID=A0ABY4QTZ8_9MYCO|nr:APC family permease [Candidatus Mycobacterium methanotrophicum]UQX13605.1 APC family permease [Candidatus Mycobacterium methanotrophicum]